MPVSRTRSFFEQYTRDFTGVEFERLFTRLFIRVWRGHFANFGRIQRGRSKFHLWQISDGCILEDRSQNTEDRMTEVRLHSG